MKNQEFEVKVLLKQNGQMASKLQWYRRENQQLSHKNEELNRWVQNLSQVFACISSAWKTITGNEQALYTLMRKKTDANSKALIAKYINHFRAFDQIVDCLGEKITNEGHSQAAALDAKNRMQAFVNNYYLFFMQFVDAYFKFNDQCLSATNEALKQTDLNQMARNLLTKDQQSKMKIKDFEAFMSTFKQNLKTYESYSQHKLLDGIVLLKNKQIDELKDVVFKQSRKISLMVDYSTHKVEKILEDNNFFECFCGGAHLQYFSKAFESSLNGRESNQMIAESSLQIDPMLKQKVSQLEDIQTQKEVLLQKNLQLQLRIEKMKVQNKITDDFFITSQPYLILKSQFKDLMDYTNDLMNKINKNNQYLNEIEKIRLEEIEQLKRKYEKQAINNKSQTNELTVTDQKSFLNFKNEITEAIRQLNQYFHILVSKSQEKESMVSHINQNLRHLKKENEQLNKRYNDTLEKRTKQIEVTQFRHEKFKELEHKMHNLFSNQQKSDEIQKLKSLWQSLVEYAKTRDKKIKAMQEMIRKKDKQIGQKTKLEEILKGALSQTEAIYIQTKEKIDKFEQFLAKTEKEFLNVAEENYKLKIEFEQEKFVLNSKIKSEQEARVKLQEKLKTYESIDQEVQNMKQREVQIENKFKELSEESKNKCLELRLQLKEKQSEKERLKEAAIEYERVIKKIIQDKERTKLDVGRLKQKLKFIQQKPEFDVIRMQLDDYKSKIMCVCGADRQREVMLRTCPHLFCRKCIEDTQNNRNRKCPICSVKFTKSDVYDICWS